MLCLSPFFLSGNVVRRKEQVSVKTKKKDTEKNLANSGDTSAEQVLGLTNKQASKNMNSRLRLT